VTNQRGGRQSQSSRSISLGGSDPRNHRQPQAASTDNDLAAPLTLDRNGRITLSLGDAFDVDSDGRMYLRLGPGLTVAPGSPLRVQIDIADESLEITKEGKIRATPSASQVKMDARKVGGLTLAEVIDREAELQFRKGAADGYCELDSSAMVPASRVPFSAIPLDLPLNSVIDPTYSHIVLRFDDNGTSAAVNHLTNVNSDTGAPVIISADGTDTDIGIDITAKGLGLVRANGSRVETYSNKNIAGGYAGLDGSSKVAPAQLPVFTSVAVGAAPASGGGTTNFLRADGTWAAPGGGGGGSGLDQPAVMARMAFGGF
jgi:hypothetical protein